MAAENRGHAPTVKKALLNKGKRFSFIQAVRLLRLLVCREEKRRPDGTVLRDAVRVRPALAMDFPGTDIVSVEENPDDAHCRFRITANFLGLYGSSSPLPSFYTEDLMDEASEDMTVTRDFLDIINAPLYPLHFQCWSKYRLGIKLLEEEDPDWLERLFCLLGLGEGTVRREVPGAYRLIRYAGLFTQKPKSAQGLETLLSDALRVKRLKIIPCIPKMRPIPPDQRCVLGVSGNSLGVDGYLGQKMTDRMGKFRIRIGPFDGKAFQAWVPESPRFKMMGNLIRAYLDQPLEWDLEVVLPRGQARTTCLGSEGWSRLGWNTWLFSAETNKRPVKTWFHPPLTERG